MTNATARAAAQAFPEAEPSPDNRPSLSRRGILVSIAASLGAAAGLAASPAIAEAVLPAQTLSSAPVTESPEFTSLVDKLRDNFLELPNVRAEENAALQRFVANAPLPSKKRGAHQSVDRIKIVRARLPLEDALKQMKPKKSGGSFGSFSVMVPVDHAYGELRRNPPGTKEGDSYRRMAGYPGGTRDASSTLRMRRGMRPL